MPVNKNIMFISPNITQQHGNILMVIIFQEVEEVCTQLQRDRVNFQRFDRISTFYILIRVIYPTIESRQFKTSHFVITSVLHESRTRTQRCLEIWTQTRTHWTHESGHVSSFGWSGEYCPIKMKEWVSNLFRHHSSMFLGNFNVITRFDSFSINF
jgi:hypothetical protein